MRNSAVEITINSLQTLVKSSDEMFADKNISDARTIGFLQGSINGVVSFLKDQLRDEEALAMIERLEDEDFVKRDLGI
jgi:hypothetical protein